MKVFWVSKRLAFGSAIRTSQHVEQLQAWAITHVINLRHGKHGKKVRQFKSLWLPFRDDMKPRPRWFYRDALRFYKRAMRKPQSQSVGDVPSRNEPQPIPLVFFVARRIRVYHTHEHRRPYSALDHEPSSPPPIERVVKSSWLWNGQTRSTPKINQQYPIRGRQREGPTDNRLLGVQHRHSGASAQNTSERRKARKILSRKRLRDIEQAALLATKAKLPAGFTATVS